MADPRYLIQQFDLANPLYINATVTAYTVLDGAKTTTKATLYADPTSVLTLRNPQKLDSTGKFSVPIYIDAPVILSIEGFGNVPEHDTGIIAGNILLAKNYADSAAADADIATTQAGLASGYATSAAGSSASAASSATDASSAAAALRATSTSSLVIGTGSKSFTIAAGKQFSFGQFLIATSDADPTNYMHGQVSSYSGTTLVINVLDVGGSGTFADWTISVSGTRGAGGSAAAGGTNGQIQVNVSGSLSGVDATGTGNVVRASGPTLTDPVVGTQAPGNNSTKAASTAYVLAALSSYATSASVTSAIAVQAATDNALYARKFNSTLTGVTGAQALLVSGAVTVGTTLGVGTNLTIGNNLYIAGGIILNTDKFIVNGSNGNTAIAGTLAVTGVATFAASPIIPTVATGDNSQKAASTAFVAAALYPAPFAIGAIHLIKYTGSPAIDPLSAGIARTAAQITNLSTGNPGICYPDGLLTGDALSGTWIPLQTMTAGKIGLWRRTA